MKRSALPGGFSLTFYLAFISHLLFHSSSHILITPFPLYVESIGGGPVEVGLSSTIFAVSAFALRPYMGRLTDTRGRKFTMLIGTVLFVLAPLAYAMSNSMTVLLLARALPGMGIAAYTTAYGALVADVTPRERWGEALGIAGMAPAISIMLGSPIGTSLLDLMGYQSVFLISAAMATAALAVTLLLREPSRDSEAQHQLPQSPAASPREVLGMRGILVPSLATLTLGLAHGTTGSFVPLFGRDRGLGNVGFFFTASSMAVLLSRSFAGRLSDRFGRLPIILPMFVTLALGYMGLNWTHTFTILIAMGVLQGMGFAGVRVGTETMVVDAAPARLRGTAYSLLYFCFDGGIALGSMVTGLLVGSIGYGTLYLLVGVLCILTAAAFGVVMHRPAPATVQT
jgi:MFS family permease